MGLDNLKSLWDSFDAVESSDSESVSEIFKEYIRKSTNWIWRVRKDESKAKKYDLLLASFLVNIILNEKYDSLFDSIFYFVQKRYSSNFLLWILSLIYIDISHYIRNYMNKELIDFSYSSKKIINFDDLDLDLDLKDRINYWIEDIIDIVSYDYSSLDLLSLIENLRFNDEILYFMSDIFIFFLKDININISKEESIRVNSFILSELFKKLESLDIEEI